MTQPTIPTGLTPDQVANPLNYVMPQQHLPGTFEPVVQMQIELKRLNCTGADQWPNTEHLLGALAYETGFQRMCVNRDLRMRLIDADLEHNVDTAQLRLYLQDGMSNHVDWFLAVLSNVIPFLIGYGYFSAERIEAS